MKIFKNIFIIFPIIYMYISRRLFKFLFWKNSPEFSTLSSLIYRKCLEDVGREFLKKQFEKVICRVTLHLPYLKALLFVLHQISAVTSYEEG